MRLKQWLRRRYDERAVRSTAARLGPLLVGAAIIGAVVNPETAVWAAVVVVIGLAMIYLAVTRPKGGR